MGGFGWLRWEGLGGCGGRVWVVAAGGSGWLRRKGLGGCQRVWVVAGGSGWFSSYSSSLSRIVNPSSQEEEEGDGEENT